MTQPDSPKSPTQKYYLTELGKQLIEKWNRYVYRMGVVSKKVIAWSKMYDARRKVERALSEGDGIFSEEP